MVKNMGQHLRQLKVEENMFLARYAESVTLFGEVVNSDNENELGYGVWRLTQEQIDQMIQNSNDNPTNTDIGVNFFENAYNYCNESIPENDIPNQLDEKEWTTILASVLLE